MHENDLLFDALADVHRRKLLLNLLRFDSQAVPELSNSSRELLESNETLLREFLSSSGGSAGVDRVLIELYHVHLPKLVEYDFVEWDRDTRVVTKGPQFDDAKPLLRFLTVQRDEAPLVDAVVPPRT